MDEGREEGGRRAPASEPQYGSRRPPHPACPQGKAHNEMYNETICRVKDVRAQTLRRSDAQTRTLSSFRRARRRFAFLSLVLREAARGRAPGAGDMGPL